MAAGGGGGSLLPFLLSAPKVPSSGFKILINNGAAATSSRMVLLNFNAGSDVKKMAISPSKYFIATSQQDYQPQIQWDICAGQPVCPKGTYNIYVKFYTAHGQPSQILSAAINYK